MRLVAGGVAAVLLAFVTLAVGSANAQPATPPAASAKQMTPEQTKAAEAAEDKRLDDIQAGLHPQHGAITLAQAKAVLNLGDRYYFLGPDDSRKVIVDAWGNPPTEAEGVLGMVFPTGATVGRNTYGVVIEYEDSGYVTDKDATQKDYDKLLADMKSNDQEINTERTKKGFDPVTLIGWAQPPSYDKANNNLIWARELSFGSEPVHTLNYDVRHLGRAGVLSMNFVSSMGRLEELRPVAAELAKTAEFEPGQRYADHKGGDKAAGYGLVGLIGAGAGLLIAKKVGLIGIGLLLAKKFAVVIIAFFGGIAAWFRRVLGLKPEAPKKLATADFGQTETQSLEAPAEPAAPRPDDPVSRTIDL
jgi:uncharacterized membrane-anchored protein